MNNTVVKSVAEPVLEQKVWKIIVVGDVNTGKTSFIERFCDKQFKKYNQCTTGIDLKMININIDNKSVVLNIWDTAGTEKYQSMIQLYYRGAKGLFIIYDITNIDSLHNLDIWMKNIDESAPSSVVKILIGAKCDMESNRMISTEEGKLVAKHFGIPFFEVSSKKNINIDDSFLRIVSMINEMESKNIIKKNSVILEDKPKVSNIDTPSKCDC